MQMLYFQGNLKMCFLECCFFLFNTKHIPISQRRCKSNVFWNVVFLKCYFSEGKFKLLKSQRGKSNVFFCSSFWILSIFGSSNFKNCSSCWIVEKRSCLNGPSWTRPISVVTWLLWNVIPFRFSSRNQLGSVLNMETSIFLKSASFWTIPRQRVAWPYPWQDMKQPIFNFNSP